MKLKTNLTAAAALTAVAFAGTSEAFAQAASLGGMSQQAVTDLVNVTVWFTYGFLVLGIVGGLNFVAALFGKGSARGGDHKASHMIASLAVCALGLSSPAWMGGAARSISGQAPGVTVQNAGQVLQIN